MARKAKAHECRFSYGLGAAHQKTCEVCGEPEGASATAPAPKKAPAKKRAARKK